MEGDGRPWGDGTEMAARAGAANDPWDEHCEVTTYVGGLAAMSAMRDSLRLAMTESQPGNRGHVYITGWRFNCLRDLSTGTQWGTDPWDAFLSGRSADADDTALGLVLGLMQAEVKVRILVWYPRWITKLKLHDHIADHFYLAKVVAAENKRLKTVRNLTEDVGVVALDVRTADLITASHHQKTMVIRGAATSVAYVGGVDLAFTRRDAPPLKGDWQSGTGIPDPALGWPKATVGVDYSSVATNVVPPNTDRAGVDLPEEFYGDARQMWHDQHLRLKGPIVKTLEHQFVERWQDTTTEGLIDVSAPGAGSMWSVGQVIFSSPSAFDAGQKDSPDPALQRDKVKPLPAPVAPTAQVGANSLVQMWRTIPWRKSRWGPPFERAEFTVMAGIENAVQQATQLILMFDQYFWSRPLARLLRARLTAVPSLHVIVILPPHADTFIHWAHHARARALNELTAGSTKTAGEYDRVAVYNLWYDADGLPDSPVNRGIYVHAKAHTYDGDLLVCGSANLNRRSFLCDSEIACAVLDPAVVLAHQSALWAYLFGGAARPNVDLAGNASDRGKQLFDQFRQAVRTGPSVLIPDPWEDTPPLLPNDHERGDWTLGFDAMYPNFLDPTSLSTAVESEGSLLSDIVFRLEKLSIGNYWPYRRGP